MSRYLIYCAAGTGGLFLTSVFANLLGIAVQPKFSNTGNSHDLGKGAWKGAGTAINFCGNDWDMCYKPECKIYYCHQGPLEEFKQENLDVKVVLININPEDYRKVTELYVCKAWPDILRDQPGEYEKWKGQDWPEYTYDVIQKHAAIRDEFIDRLYKETSNWMKNHKSNIVDEEINFRTVMGISGDLAEECSKIVNRPVTDHVKTLIQEYHETNKRLYFAN